MASITGSELLAKSLKAQGMDTLFYLMGGPMLETESACIKLGVRAIDSRHEQGASMMAHAYSRLTRRPGVCMASSGPGTINMATGVANAFIDAAPLVAVGGVWWSDAASALQTFVETAGIPFYTTPISRGSVPEDHDLAFLFARAKAFAEADVILNVGTRFNYVIQFGRAPRFAENLKVIQVDVDPTELGHNRPADVPIFGDARAVLQQLTTEARGRLDKGRYGAWVGKLKALDMEKALESEKAMSSDEVPIHPLRLCKEVRDFLRRDAILVVDGQEILNFGRQSIPTFTAGHRLNSGPFGCMGVGLPFGVGAKVARPDTQVVVLHGDGSYGINAMEFDTAVRHRIPVLVVISNNGGWTADPQRSKPGRTLGFTRYDKVAEDFGGYGEFVEKPHEIRPALARAYTSGKPAVVNVKTDYKARATTVRFSAYTT